MPELTVLQIGLLAGALIMGVVIGWFVRADRCAKEKIAVNASWQDQLESQQSEHSRLAEQNKSLMEQISQYQASQKDHTNRAKELSESLKEAFARRDGLQRQLKDMRAKLELAVVQRNKAREALELRPAEQSVAMKEKDDKIFNLSRELTSWQSRVPPLVERFQTRDAEARALEEELAKTRDELQALEARMRSDNTRIEPVDADSLPDGGDASNEPIAMTATHETAALQDQIDNGVEEIDELEDFVDPVEEEDLRPVVGGEDLEEVFATEQDAQESGKDLEDVFAAKQDSRSGEDDADDEDVAAEARADDRQSSWAAGSLTTEGNDVESGVAGKDAAENVAEPKAGSGSDWDDDDVPGNGQQAETGAETFPGNGQTPHAVAVSDVDSASSDSGRDDLQKIKGIGPSIERTLNDLGVYRFHQIAEMSEYDIDRVAQQLKGFRSRIYREDWIGQARDLQYEKNNRRP